MPDTNWSIPNALLEEKGFIQLIHENQRLIHKICFLYEKDLEARTDLFQDIVLQLWKSRQSFRGESKPTTWMYRVALNTAISGLRKKRTRPILEHLEERQYEHPEAQSGDLEEESRRLYEAIRHLSPVDRAIVMMALDEVSNEEIGATIGITQNNVRVRMNRIRERLRKMLRMS